MHETTPAARARMSCCLAPGPAPQLYRHWGLGISMTNKNGAWNEEVTWATLGSDATPLSLWCVRRGAAGGAARGQG